MKRILRYAQIGLNVAADELEDKGTPRARKLAKLLRAADAGISEYLRSGEV